MVVWILEVLSSFAFYVIIQITGGMEGMAGRVLGMICIPWRRLMLLVNMLWGLWFLFRMPCRGRLLPMMTSWRKQLLVKMHSFPRSWRIRHISTKYLDKIEGIPIVAIAQCDWSTCPIVTSVIVWGVCPHLETMIWRGYWSNCKPAALVYKT